jgi:hypothetical protein
LKESSDKAQRRSAEPPLWRKGKMTDRNSMLEFADDLEMLFQGHATVNYIRGKYSVSPAKNIEVIFAYVEHFLSDTDIREKDAKYCQMQETEMQKLIQALRSGDLNSAKKINFLG